ncbi:MAG TPA: HAD family hydrolase [Oscillospiraceae bacterium]|nr:HAD family hydrolase [Oscillospiraceae bacterium]
MSIITVDFDGTLYQHNSVITTLKVGKTMFTLKQWFYVARDVVKGIVNKTTGEKIDFQVLFLESFFLQMKGKNMEELHNFFMSLIETGQQGINYNLISRLVEHSENGDRIVVLSGALQPFLEVFVQQLDIQADVIGTLLFYDEKGTCTGKMGKINHGVEKVNRLKLWISENYAEGETVWAYADSESDIPLLEFADKAIVVRPSNALKKVAELKGWETFTPSKKTEPV